MDDKEDLFLNLTSEADVLVDQCNKEQKPFIELELFFMSTVNPTKLWEKKTTRKI